MLSDLDIIKEIENRLKISLKQVDYAKILNKDIKWRGKEYGIPAFSIDNNNNVVGLGLDCLNINEILELITGFLSIQLLSLKKTNCIHYTFLSRFKQLRYLNLSECLIQNVLLPDCLIYLDLSFSNLLEVTDLKGLTNLQILNLTGIQSICNAPCCQDTDLKK